MTFDLARIHALLEDSRLRIQSEIRNYPMPIPACDAHFNWLLEQRGRLTDAIDATRTAVSGTAAQAMALKAIAACTGEAGYMDCDNRERIALCLEATEICNP